MLHRRENVDGQSSSEKLPGICHSGSLLFCLQPCLSVSLLCVFIQAVKHNGGTKETRTNVVANLYDFPATIAFTGKCRKSWKMACTLVKYDCTMLLYIAV